MTRPRLTPALLDEIQAAAHAGCKDPTIYRALGIPRQRGSEWLRDEEGPLARRLGRARALMARDLLQRIATCLPNWQRLVWLLVQHFPGNYTRPSQDTHPTGKDNGPLAHRVVPYVKEAGAD